MASRSSGIVRRITTSVWRTTTFLASARDGMRFAVRGLPGEAVAMLGDPPVHDVLNEPDARDTVDQQRQAGAKGDRPCSGPGLGAAVDVTGRVQPPHGCQQLVVGNATALGHSHACNGSVSRLPVRSCRTRKSRERVHIPQTPSKNRTPVMPSLFTAASDQSPPGV